MSEETPGIGAGLRRAREAKGWSTQDVGSRLRLMSRQVEAIEEEEFSRLGPPVFARGFVRNYAKLMGLNPDEMLDQMTRIKVSRVQEGENVPFTPRQGFWTSPWAIGGIIAAVLLIAIPVGLYLWLNSGEEEAEPPAQQLVQPPPPPPAPQLEVQPTAPAGTSGQPAAPSAPVVQPAPAAVPAAPAQAAPPTQPAPAVPAKPAVPATAVPAPVNAVSVFLKFDEASWAQVRDASGKLVLSGLNPAGSSVEVKGKAPFFLVLGNAGYVHVLYKGQVVDLTPFTAVNVARLTLNP